MIHAGTARLEIGCDPPQTVADLLAVVLMLIGLVLLTINAYGEMVGMRAAERVPLEAQRFENDLSIGADDLPPHLQRRTDEDDAALVARLVVVVSDALLHLDRWEEHPPDAFFQRVPFAENPYLNVLGHISGMPQIERYHFTDHSRTLERGIGLCGDHAIVLSGLLGDFGIDNRLVSYASGHVVVQVTGNSEAKGIYDADFGISLPDVALDDMSNALVRHAYAAGGYSTAEIDALLDIYATVPIVFDGVRAFMGKRYLFERASYIVKWLLPLALVAIAAARLFCTRRSPSRRHLPPRGRRSVRRGA